MALRKKINIKRYLLRSAAALFLLMNLSAIMHAYRFTHFGSSEDTRSKNPEAMGFGEKLNALFFGASLPRPVNTSVPARPYESFVVDSMLSCWYIPVDSSKPTVLLFHGYGNRKCGMLDRSEALNELGYNTVLVDFAGAGDSPGNTCTIGYQEAEQVKRCYDYLRKKLPQSKLYLLGSSMGAAAITRCVAEYGITPDAIVLECPFGSLLDAAGNRFDAVGLPRFPLVHLLIFYGGAMNGFWAFHYKPTEYAKKITVPCLHLVGGKDERVSAEESNLLFQNLSGPKKQIIYPEAKHESYLNDYRTQWKQDVQAFLSAH